MNDLTKLSGRIKHLLDDPEEADAEREAFYKRYVDNYTPDKNTGRHIEVYEEILKENGRR